MDRGFKLIMWYVVAAFAVIALLVGLASCNSAKQAQRHYDLAKKKNIVIVARNARNDWPCITTKRDTLWRDSIQVKDRIVPQLVQVECPDTAQGAKPGSTMPVMVKADCHCEDSSIVNWAYITDYIEDSSKLFDARYQIDSLVAATQDQSVKLSGVVRTRNILWTVLGTIAATFILLLIFKLK